MEQRDYLMRQIELMTQTLVSLIRRLLGLKDITEEDIQQTTDEVLKEQLDISIEQIMKTEPETLIELLIKRNGITKSNLNLFADILEINARVRIEPNEKLKLLKIALELYEWTDTTDNTFSMERHQKMNKIRDQLENEF